MEGFVPSKLFLRSCLLYEFHQKNLATKATKNICAIYGEVLQVRQCQKWFRKFKSGNFSLEDKPRSGTPKVIDEDHIAAEIEANPEMSIQEITDKTGYSWSSVQRSLKNIGKIGLL